MSIIRGLENTFVTLDPLVLNLKATAKDTMEAFKYGDRLGTAQSSIEHGKGYIDGVNYSTLATEKAVSFGVISGVDGTAVHVIHQLTAANVVAGLGVILSSLTIILQSISIYRQDQVLKAIPNKVNLSVTGDLNKVLDNLEKINYNHFKKALPIHLQERVEKEFGGDNVFKKLKAEIEKGSTENAEKLITEIKDYASRKRVVHILALIGGIVGLAGSIALLLACPPLVLLLFTVVGLGITIACALMTKGWVENPEKGFNRQLLLPEFLQTKKEEEESIELGFFVKDGITPGQPLFVASEDIKIKTIKPEVVNGPTFLEKLKGLFKSENKESKVFIGGVELEDPLNPKKKTIWEKFMSLFSSEDHDTKKTIY